MWKPQGVKISELPAGSPIGGDVIPFANLASDETQKTTVNDLALVPTVANLGMALALDSGMWRFS